MKTAYVNEKRETNMRLLSAAIVRAVEKFYEREENLRLFEAWRDARSERHVEKEKEAKAC